MYEESPCGVPEHLVRDRGVSHEEAGTEADIEDDNVDFVGGPPALAISGFDSEEFVFSEIVRRKRLERQTLSEGVVDSASLPQPEFSKLQHLPLTFNYLDILTGQYRILLG